MKKNKQENKPEVNEYEEKWRRALADYQNLQKRTVMERAQFVRLANVGLMEKFLVVLDDLYRANDHLGDKGLEMVIGQFEKVLESEGVFEIEALGAEFDPKNMECLDQVPGEVNKVIKVVRRGYMLEGGNVLRPAQVHVGKKEDIWVK